MFGESINRTQQAVTASLHSYLCNTMLVSHLVFANLCFVGRGTAENFSWILAGPGCSLLLMPTWPRPGCFCWIMALLLVCV